MRAIKYLILPIICMALLLPQLLFGLQDRYQMENISRGRREGIDPTLLNAEFVEGSIAKKLGWLAAADNLGHELHLLEVENDLYRAQQVQMMRTLYEQFPIEDLLSIVLYNGEIYPANYKSLKNPNVIYANFNRLNYNQYYFDFGEYLPADASNSVKDKVNMTVVDADANVDLPGVLEVEMEWHKYLLLDEEEQQALELRGIFLYLKDMPEYSMQLFIDADELTIYYIRYNTSLLNLGDETYDEDSWMELLEMMGIAPYGDADGEQEEKTLVTDICLESSREHRIYLLEYIQKYLEKYALDLNADTEGMHMLTMHYFPQEDQDYTLHFKYTFEINYKIRETVRIGIYELEKFLPEA